jgi:hypothetical protein
MGSQPRSVGKWARLSLALAGLLLTLNACTAAVGGGVVALVVAIGAATSHCYDYLDVRVVDGQGRKTCDARVVAANGGDQFELKSCYYAPLTDGHWTLRASLPGYPDAVSSVDVLHEHGCTRYVQSLELTLTQSPTGLSPAPFAPPRSSARPVASPEAAPE